MDQEIGSSSGEWRLLLYMIRTESTTGSKRASVLQSSINCERMPTLKASVQAGKNFGYSGVAGG
jgi:hypothetical protein